MALSTAGVIFFPGDRQLGDRQILLTPADIRLSIFRFSPPFGERAVNLAKKVHQLVRIMLQRDFSAEFIQASRSMRGHVVLLGGVQSSWECSWALL